MNEGSAAAGRAADGRHCVRSRHRVHVFDRPQQCLGQGPAGAGFVKVPMLL